MTKVYQKEDLQILISTMNRSDLIFLNAIFPFHNSNTLNLIIVNQTTENQLLKSDNKNIKIINSFEKGLSKSRNLALQLSEKKLLVIADDDVIYKPNFEDDIIKAFELLNCDILTFQIESAENQLIRKYSKKSKAKLNWFDVLNTHSIEMVLNREAIFGKNLKFNENFGLGATFSSGEEAVFMANAKQKLLKLGFFASSIVIHNQETSTFKLTKNQNYFNQGAIFYAIFGKLYTFWIALKLFFDFKQNQINLKECYHLFLSAKKGKSQYEKRTR